MTPLDTPRLIADIGGTYARFALETALGRFEHSASLRCADHTDFFAAVRVYLSTLAKHHARTVKHAAVAIANPVEGDSVRMTNYHWQFSIEEMRQRLALNTLVVVNDFTALAMAVPQLKAAERRPVGGGLPRDLSVVGVLGAGTGLGVSGLIPSDGGWVALGTEGGHTNFAPRDEREMGILRHATKKFGHVSFERLLSGPGIELIHRALADMKGNKDKPLLAPEITRRALDGSDKLCVESLEVFCLLMGTAAANLAVTLGATGGIYIGGGIVPRLGAAFDASGFRARFEDKGRFSDYVKAIPTYVITSESATFIGASAILESQLRALQATPRSSILEQVQRSLDGLSPAERRVADHVLVHPRAALNDPIAQIAQAARVSQPTVIRFCRSLGCEGLSDFKLRLASGLTGAMPVTHVQVTRDDSTLEVGTKVLGNTASAILQVRDHLNRETMDRVIALIDQAERIEFHAVGQYGVVAMDAQYKFLRFGIPCNTYTDARLQQLAANAVRPKDLVIIISHSGQVPELLTVAQLSQERGATVVAITASQSPLARKADVTLIVDHVEDVTTQLPMVSRILHLLVIDMLAVGVAMLRSSTPVLSPDPLEPDPLEDEVTPPSRLTSHSS
jgi:glucokinase